MSDCNCKKGKNFAADMSEDAVRILEAKDRREKIVHYTTKGLVFIVALILSPLLWGMMMWFVFKTLVLNKEVDLLPLLKNVADKFKKPEEEDEEEDEDEFDPEDYVLMDVENLDKVSSN